MGKNYKDTLLMPQTNFEMRANLTQKEQIWQQYWENQGIYQKLITKNQALNKQSFILHDGPPYANGNLHLGHALNKILKDIIVRYYNSNGFYAPYIPGWDTHGLPIESAITNLGINRKTISPSAFRKECQTYAEKQVINQINQFKQLGLLTDFKEYYVTYDAQYEAEQIKVFGQMVEKQLVYRNLYPVYWSPISESALAEAEIEYLPKTSAAIYVAFLLNDQKQMFTLPTSLVIWTTTPWTIPANQLLAVNTEFEYDVIKIIDQQYLVAKQLVNSFIAANEIVNYQIMKTIKGKDLINQDAFHPLYQRKTLIVHSDHVTLSDGTGIVHIAPGFGEDDFELGLKYHLEILCPINDQGYFTKEVNDETLVGKFYDDTNKMIAATLKANGNLLGMKWFKHQYPHDWRTKTPVIYRATLQWFIAIEKIKPQLCNSINKVNFIPEWGKKRMLLMTNSRYDWCISRQRTWGIPIPIFYGEDQQPILDIKVINHVATLFAKHGSKIWFEKTEKDLLPPNYRHRQSPNGIFYKEQDIMDVWYDSGISHLAVIKNRHLPWPVDLYLEGNDQFRGWFNSSLAIGTITNGQSPYKNCLAHGFVVDAKGNKMSKSIGNIISVAEICQTYGADILRLWVTSVDFHDDMRIGTEILKQISENYRKIRNIFRFLLGNLFDFDVKTVNNIVDINAILPQLAPVDQYLLVKLNNLVEKVNQAYQKYEFNLLYHLILNFITNDLSAFYCDFTKDILYVNHKDDPRRKQVQTTMFFLIKTLMGLLAPILPHTCEEAFHSLFGLTLPTSKASIHLLPFPQVAKIKQADKLHQQWKRFMMLRDDVNRAFEQAKQSKIIKNALESLVVISFKADNDEIKQTINEKELAQLLIVSAVEYGDNQTIAGTWAITIKPKSGSKCPRCWLIVTEIKNDICLRCDEVLLLNNSNKTLERK